MQRPRAIDTGLLTTVMQQMSLNRVVIEAPRRTTVIDGDNTRHALAYAPTAEAAYEAQLALHGGRICPPIAITKTHVVDLANGLEATMHGYASIARRNVRRALRSTEIRYETVSFSQASSTLMDEISALHELFRQPRPWLLDQSPYRRAMVTHFGDRGWFSLAWRDRQLLGVVYMLIHDRVASYHTAISHPDALAARVPTGLVYHAMKEAISTGCDLFDFVGLYDDRYPDRYPRWKGFSTFKMRFGGLPVNYPPSFEIIQAPVTSSL